MTILQKKIPRGVIYHSLFESAIYLIRSLFSPLTDRNIISSFEQCFARYAGRAECVVFPFARVGIHAILKSLDLPARSEVILPPITIKGIVDVVVDLGLVPVYLDIDPETINISPVDLERVNSPRVRVAIITPLFGLVPNITAIVEHLRKNNVFIIEDFSQCLNGRYGAKRIGTFGDAGVYSASSIKTLDTLGGGMVITDDLEFAAALRSARDALPDPRRGVLVKKAWVNMVRNIATTQPFFTLLTFPLLQFIRHRDPASALKQTGGRNKERLSALPAFWFYRFTSVQARIGLEHIFRVDETDRARIANADFIKSHCEAANFPKTTSESINVYWQLILPVPDAIVAQEYFARKGIDCATSSLELVCALTGYPNSVDLPQASRIYRNGILIPCFPELSHKDLARIVSAINDLAPQHDNV